MPAIDLFQGHLSTVVREVFPTDHILTITTWKERDVREEKRGTCDSREVEKRSERKRMMVLDTSQRSQWIQGRSRCWWTPPLDDSLSSTSSFLSAISASSSRYHLYSLCSPSPSPSSLLFFLFYFFSSISSLLLVSSLLLCPPLPFYPPGPVSRSMSQRYPLLFHPLALCLSYLSSSLLHLSTK